ncbi:MAG: type II secretion system minor pseudopilin GspI [Pseudomonadota bacterium]
MSRPRRFGPSRAGGFTLIEVMVALVIAALGLAAVITMSVGAIDNANVFRDRALALYVGLNVITELRLSDEFPDPGDTEDEVELADRDWFWRAEISETESDALRRVEVSVASAETPDTPIRTVVGFVGEPRTGNAANAAWQGLTGAVE